MIRRCNGGWKGKKNERRKRKEKTGACEEARREGGREGGREKK